MSERTELVDDLRRDARQAGLRDGVGIGLTVIAIASTVVTITSIPYTTLMNAALISLMLILIWNQWTYTTNT